MDDDPRPLTGEPLSLDLVNTEWIDDGIRHDLPANHECILHFYDASRGGRRQWCSMAVCGNRAKARRHYERTRGQ